MFDDRKADEEVLEAWKGQDTTALRIAPEQMLRRIEAMDRKNRRTVYDVYLAVAVISAGMIAFAAISSNRLMAIGAALTAIGYGLLAWLVRRNFRPGVAELPEASVKVYRAQLERQAGFFRRALWLRLLCVTPGPLLFSLGLAAAYPKAAPIIYVQLVTFVAILIATVPLSRRKAATLEREIAEMLRLEAEPHG
jgi:hypothetical protein